VGDIRAAAGLPGAADPSGRLATGVRDSMPDPETLYLAAASFPLAGPIRAIEPLGAGLINATFCVTAGDLKYVLQRINRRVFPCPEQIMDNLQRLTRHWARQVCTDLRLPELIPAKDGLPCVRRPDGDVWRMLSFIPDAIGLECLNTPAQAREIGRALGRFHQLASALDPASLAVTLPGFHVTPRYLDQFNRSLERVEPDERSAEVQSLAAFIAEREGLVGVLEAARHEGRIPLRVVHGDPKLDNFLFDRVTGRMVSLIDLDTVQPGLLHHDIADCLRSCCNRRGESADGTAVEFDLTICREILEAFAQETVDLLGPSEVELLYEAIRLIPFELGLRFLTDHLEGDRYFRVDKRGRNLRKATIQFALVRDIERKEPAIRTIIAAGFYSPSR
jgi:Ser/Thr protein kinase RdoA (MazF antagonist)